MEKLTITDVRAIPGDSAFLIDDGKTSVLYDTGFAFTGYQVADNIKKTLGERNLDYIFLTHSHYDHALGSAYIARRYPETKIVAGAYAEKIFAKPSARAIMRDLDRKFARTCGVSDYEDLIDELRVDICVQDGDVIEAGNMRFTAINLPGHTRCSVGYYLAEKKLLLSSETLGVYLGEDTVLPSYLVGYGMTLDSIQRVEMLSVEHVLIPHFGLLEKEQTKRFLKKSKQVALEVAEEIKSILLAGGTREDAELFFRDKYYTETVKPTYPEAAFQLNTSIMVKLIEQELLS